MKEEPIVRCEHVCVAYDRQEVLHDVCLDLPRGELIPFVGPNGAGKTTLLRAMLGLVPLKTGRILLRSGSAPGYVPQQKVIDPLFPVSARRIVRMGLHARLGCWGRERAEDRKRVDACLERLDLAAHAEKTFGELSGGMRQKVMLARALAAQVEVLVLDEPTSELDEKTEREVLAHLRELVDRQGLTVLMAHHGHDQAAALGDQVCEIARGRARLMPGRRRAAEVAP